MNDAEKFIKIRNDILNWFYKNREDHFFRKDRTPYKVWVSEVILQQTRIAAAREKLFSFLKRFPDLDNLANARESEVLEAFKGLGYYNRARQLHKGAKELLNHKDFFLGDFDSLLNIPSIGPYTAGAISSICFDIPVPVIDGNIKRILSRIFAIDGYISDKRFEEKIKKICELFFINTTEKPGFINESLMEFGQKICIAKNPACKNCFINNQCKAYGNKNERQYPLIKKTIYEKVLWNVFLIFNDNKVAMNQYSDFPFLKNQFGFPSVLEFLEQNKTFYSQKFLKNLNMKGQNSFTQGPKHTITRHKIQFNYLKISNFSIPEANQDIIYVPIDVVEKKIISSGLMKLWRLSLKELE